MSATIAERLAELPTSRRSRSCSARAISRSPSTSRSPTSATRASSRSRARTSARRRKAISRSPSRSRAWSGSRREKRGGHWFAGGLLLQHLPEGEEGRERLHTRLDHPDWPHVAILGGSVKAEELTDPELPLDDLIWRLFHEEEEVRTLAGDRAQPRLPLRSRLCPLGHRPLPGRRARGDGRRRRPDPGRLRLLLVELRDRAERAEL